MGSRRSSVLRHPPPFVPPYAIFDKQSRVEWGRSIAGCGQGISCQDRWRDSTRTDSCWGQAPEASMHRRRMEPRLPLKWMASMTDKADMEHSYLQLQLPAYSGWANADHCRGSAASSGTRQGQNKKLGVIPAQRSVWGRKRQYSRSVGRHLRAGGADRLVFCVCASTDDTTLERRV